MKRFVVLISTISCILITQSSIADANKAKNADPNFTKIWEEIYQQDYDRARILAQKKLKENSESISLLSIYEVALNGSNRPKKADEIHQKIQSIWQKKFKAAYLDANYPINLATYIRMVVVRENVLLVASDYFIPYPINKDKTGFYYHKFTLYNRYSKTPTKFFKLERSLETDRNYVLFEIDETGETKKVKSYGRFLPEIQDEVKDLSKKLGL